MTTVRDTNDGTVTSCPHVNDMKQALITGERDAACICGSPM